MNYPEYNEQLSLELDYSICPAYNNVKIGPTFRIEQNNKIADIYDRFTHYTIELYTDSTWTGVKLADTEEQAKSIANEYVTN